jgi:hypothetical protein
VNGTYFATDDGNDCVVFYNAVSEGGNSGALLFKSDPVTTTPSFMHIGGDENVVKRGYAIEFPAAAVPMVQFTPIRAAEAHGTALTWVVQPDESLRLNRDRRPEAEQALAEIVTAQVSWRRLPDCQHDNIVSLSRQYSCGRGEVVGVLLNVATPYRPHRTKLDAIDNGWVGPADVAKPEARDLLQALLGTDRVDHQLAALDGLCRIGPAVGSTGVHLICHLVDQKRSGGVDPATVVRALEVLPQLVTRGCSDNGSCEVVLGTAHNALSRGSCWVVRAAATAAIQTISGWVHGNGALCPEPLNPSDACGPCHSCGNEGDHLETMCPQRRAAEAKVGTWDRKNCFRCNKPGHWSAACTVPL